MLLSAASVAADALGERAANDGHRRAVVLRQRPHGAAAEVRARRVAAVADEVERTILSRPPRTKIAPPPPPSSVSPVLLPPRTEVLHDEARRGLVIAVRRRPGLPLVAGVLVEDPALPAAAERDQAAAIEDDPTAGVDHLGGLLQLDPNRARPAAEPDDPAFRDRPDDRARRAAPRRAFADPSIGVRGVNRPRLAGTGTAALAAGAATANRIRKMTSSARIRTT